MIKEVRNDELVGEWQIEGRSRKEKCTAQAKRVMRESAEGTKKIKQVHCSRASSAEEVKLKKERINNQKKGEEHLLILVWRLVYT